MKALTKRQLTKDNHIQTYTGCYAGAEVVEHGHSHIALLFTAVELSHYLRLTGIRVR